MYQRGRNERLQSVSGREEREVKKCIGEGGVGGQKVHIRACQCLISHYN